MAIARHRFQFEICYRCHNCCTLNCCTKNDGHHRHHRNPSTQSRDLAKRMKRFNQSFIILISLISLALLANWPTFVAAAATATRNAVRSIAINENDVHRLHGNWFEFQRQSLNHRTQRQSQPAAYQSQELGNIFSQLGFFIQSRQRNASELSGNIFFKYYNT